jgi:predicted O-methyltransferase YrrM
MNIENALKIEGAMDPPELEWLAEQASKHKKIVEVGCWQGRSTMVLADNTEGVVWAIDHWDGSEEHKEMLKERSPDWLYNEFSKNLKKHLDACKVFPKRMVSVEMARRFGQVLSKPMFDMVFIDASHDYANVSADIMAWAPLVVPGGLLCGHDAGYPPVARAVQELLGFGVKHAGVIWYKEML